jgi:hypothetical protein
MLIGDSHSFGWKKKWSVGSRKAAVKLDKSGRLAAALELVGSSALCSSSGRHHSTSAFPVRCFLLYCARSRHQEGSVTLTHRLGHGLYQRLPRRRGRHAHNSSRSAVCQFRTTSQCGRPQLPITPYSWLRFNTHTPRQRSVLTAFHVSSSSTSSSIAISRSTLRCHRCRICS